MFVFLTLNICRKLRISLISSSQWIMSLVGIFELFEENWCRLIKQSALFLGVTQKYELRVSFEYICIQQWWINLPLIVISTKLQTWFGNYLVIGNKKLYLVHKLLGLSWVIKNFWVLIGYWVLLEYILDHGSFQGPGSCFSGMP